MQTWNWSAMILKARPARGSLSSGLRVICCSGSSTAVPCTVTPPSHKRVPETFLCVNVFGPQFRVQHPPKQGGMYVHQPLPGTTVPGQIVLMTVCCFDGPNLAFVHIAGSAAPNEMMSGISSYRTASFHRWLTIKDCWEDCTFCTFIGGTSRGEGR